MSENLQKHDQDVECDEAEDEAEDKGHSEEANNDECDKCSRQEVHECSKETNGQSASTNHSEVPNHSKSKDNEPTEEQTNANTAKDCPKRELAFTSKRLLKLLTQHLKTSMDGTLKSCCRLWRQQFIWMVKLKGVLIQIFLIGFL